jgi:hypothetical protein
MNTKLSLLAAGMAAATALLVPAAPPAQAATTVPQCTNADLHASIRGSDGAAGTIYHRLVLTNVSQHSCVTGGFGGVSFVGHGDGTQVGAPATRVGRARTLVVAPGHRVVSTLGVADWQNFPRRTCRPVHADGYRVYVPNATRSQYIAAPQTVCGNPAVHELSHTAYRRP